MNVLAPTPAAERGAIVEALADLLLDGLDAEERARADDVLAADTWGDDAA